MAQKYWIIDKPAGKRSATKRYGVRWQEEDGRRPSEFFTTKRERGDWIAEHKDLSREFGADGMRVAKDNIQKLHILDRIYSKLDGKGTLDEAVDYFLKHHVKEFSFDTVWSAYIEAKQFEHVDSDYIRHLMPARRQFELWLTMNKKDWQKLSGSDARHFLGNLRKENGEDFGPCAQSNYRSYLRTFYFFAQKEKQAVKVNPFSSLKMPENVLEEVSVLSVKDTKALFKSCLEHCPEFAGPLALSFFGGLRSSSIYRLEPKDIRRDQMLIILPGKKFKTKRRHTVQTLLDEKGNISERGLPSIVWEWMDLTPTKYWNWLNRRRFDYVRKRIVEKANLVLPHNVGRHSLSSYHVAYHGNAHFTATLIGHRRDVKMLYDHYKGHTTQQDAKVYLSLTPQKLG